MSSRPRPPNALALALGVVEPAAVGPTDAVRGRVEDLPITLSVEEVALLLRVSTKTVYDLHKAKELRGGRKFGGQLRFHRDELLRFIAGSSSAA